FVHLPPLDGISAYGITPGWFYSADLWVYPSVAASHRDTAIPNFYGINTPPRFGDLEDRDADRWVSITAHFDDRRAQSCRATGPPDARPTRRQTIAICQSELVLLSIRPLSSLPETATDPPPAPEAGPSGSTVVALTFVAIVTFGLTTRVLRR